MTLLKKLKNIFNHTPKDNTTATTNTNPSANTPYAHLSPISNRVRQWLDDREWKYEHFLPSEDDELRTHHFVIGFKDGDFFWNCVIYIHEKNQLLSFQGVLLEPIDAKYFLPIMAIFTAININIGIGSLELDVINGVVRAKIGIDAEFSSLSDEALGCYLHNLAGLTEKAYETVISILQDPDPNQNLLQILDEQGILQKDKEAGGYYLINDENHLS